MAKRPPPPKPSAGVGQAAAQAAFLEAYAKTGNITAACKAAKCGRTTVHDWRHNDPTFAGRFEDAREEAVERLEAEARRRAVQGTEKAVYHNGKVVGYERQYSDTLLIFLLKASRPEVYRERYEQKVVGGESPVKVEDVSAARAVMQDRAAFQAVLGALKAAGVGAPEQRA